MKKYNEENHNAQEDFEERLVDAITDGTPDDVREILKEGFEIDLNYLMQLVMYHCRTVEDVKILKEAGYNFKGDNKAVEEFATWAALDPKILQFMLDNGAVISWKAIQKCADRYSIETLRLMINSKKDFFPVD